MSVVIVEPQDLWQAQAESINKLIQEQKLKRGQFGNPAIRVPVLIKKIGEKKTLKLSTAQCYFYDGTESGGPSMSAGIYLEIKESGFPLGLPPGTIIIIE